MEKEDYYETVANYSLSPNLENTEDSPPHPVQVAWSDKDMLAYNRCIFGSLTNYGLVTLHILRNSQWIVILNLSEEIIKLYEKDWDDHPSSPYDQFFTLKDRVSQVKSATICWSSKFGKVNGWYSYFLTGQTNGDILVWKIPSVVNEEFQSEPKYLCRFNVDLKRMCTLNWFSISPTKVVITVGDLKGIIKLYEVTLEPKDPDKFIVKYLLDIWPESDNISVKKVVCLGEGHNLRDKFFVAFKGNFLVVMSVSDDGALIDKTSRHMGGFNVVGCAHMNENSLMLTTQQGNMIKVKISKSCNDKIDLNVAEFKSNIDMSEKLCFGLVSSSNKMIWLMANSIYKPHDHLVLREPTNIVLFTMNSHSNPVAVLRNNPSKSLTTYWDCLELFRVFLTRGKEFQVGIKTESLSSLSMYELCCNLWKLTIRTKIESQENECPAEMKALLRSTEDAIFLKRAHQVLQKLLSADESTLTNEQIISFGLYYKWLKNYIDECHEKDKIVLQTLLNSLEKEVSFLASIPEEKCALCGENILLNIKYKLLS
ncbi:hypothetical protein J437_LFUL010063 [Ladona fulva]|uniref:Transcription factor IIIC 90kDa subunit N-terminal domain-containing protein n=1 Tax=Ladona fulva TaxID=123851 RepID=A0A8K0P3C1_LADFU|nr:hypothetical protein J437_LFUL010063 [Ladona fulva]